MGEGQFDHDESENRVPETLGPMIRAPGPKNLKKVKHFKVIISRFYKGRDSLKKEGFLVPSLF